MSNVLAGWVMILTCDGSVFDFRFSLLKVVCSRVCVCCISSHVPLRSEVVGESYPLLRLIFVSQMVRDRETRDLCYTNGSFVFEVVQVIVRTVDEFHF